MDRGAGDLDAVGEGRLVDLEPVEAPAAEGGDQRGVDVEDALREAGGEVRREDGQEAREDEHVDALRFERGEQPFLEFRLIPAVLPGHDDGRHAGLGRALEGVDAGPARHDEGDPPAFELPAFLGVEEGLQIGPAAGYQNGDTRFFHHSSTTFSSPRTISPIT